ncbi:uncharacterized protein BO88DRAFT_416971 [Aspergillus vadensis CBS 113365]|uniref:Uncharacterized protein n=1 Tax=Aspergillus vadensis (strain CBS 113365 / IMI 142717 / IBT 24658) TaxID=1448311 RepID=A0A319B4Y7_ASPVC|nr:hypothetical protein BO88DRAFT_416971 [Aspergillus vadensis CBS 113365]PYH67485.1 hypothetical protein BO88DRAFT_416971 [Aspergillus vadensis CBS 113365]
MYDLHGKYIHHWVHLTHRGNITPVLSKSMVWNNWQETAALQRIQSLTLRPVITGWKSLFGAAGQVEHGWIEGVSRRESQILKTYFHQLIAENHDLQVSFKWGVNDVAVWDKGILSRL